MNISLSCRRTAKTSIILEVRMYVNLVPRSPLPLRKLRDKLGSITSRWLDQEMKQSRDDETKRRVTVRLSTLR